MSGRKLRKLKFPKEEEDCMVAFMKDHPFMWDVSSENFRNTKLKDQKWKDLAQMMGARNGKFFVFMFFTPSDFFCLSILCSSIGMQ